MFAFSSTAEVFLHRDPVDFRKQIDSLAVLVQSSLSLDPMREALFVFTNRRADRIKVLWWDRNGFCLWTKRLEQARFVWPREATSSSIVVNGETLEWLLRGFDVFRFPPHQRLRFSAVC